MLAVTMILVTDRKMQERVVQQLTLAAIMIADDSVLAGEH